MCNGSGSSFDDPDCKDITDFTSASMHVDDAVVSVDQPGSCAAAAGEPTVPGCQLDQALSCNAGAGVCVPFNKTTACVVIADNSDCPTSHPDYPHPRTLQQSAGGTCGCDCQIDQETCPQEMTLYSDSNCTMGAVAVTINGTCVATTATSVGSVKAPDASTLTCAATPNPSNVTDLMLCCEDAS